MVTVTAPMYKGSVFYGVSTIDLKLNGLKSLLENSTKALQGYAFALDRNGKFLSFPKEKLVTRQVSGKLDYLYLTEFIQTHSEFTEIATAIQNLKKPEASLAHQQLSQKIADESYQINLDEAAVITDIITTEKNTPLILKPTQFILDNDYFLNSPVLVSIVTMPETHWKIILVSPLDKIAQARHLLYSQLSVVMIAYFTFLTLFILGYLNRVLIRPLRKISTSKEGKNIFLNASNASEIQQLADLFNQRSQQLTEVSRAKSEFLSNMSHEFRTPLNAIMGFSQLLETNPHSTLTKSQLDYVHYIYTASEHLNTLISNILEFFKNGSGKN
ncbi:MAG: histidine kinase dimerization/phospho-acceptor domain-containing protein [Methylococcales bacterium]|nr:histidine kinase dimerization/phospho-acceptor domain-containing protein [Methylococcales bacterium]